MITLAMGAEIRASRSAVWHALVDPAEVMHWRPGAEGRPEAQPGWPRPGQSLTWRCRLHELPVRARQRSLSMAPGDRLRAELHMGLFRLEETLSLAGASGPGERTRVGIRIVAGSQVPLVGGNLDRFSVRRFATEHAAATLQALRDWCERGATPLEGLDSAEVSRE